MKTSAKFVKMLENVNTLDCVSNSPKRSPQFSPVYEGMENMFYFLNHASKLTQLEQLEMHKHPISDIVIEKKLFFIYYLNDT